MTRKVKRAICFPIIAFLLIVLIAANVAAGIFAGAITNYFSGGVNIDFNSDSIQQTLQQSDELVRTLAEDSIVLLKNQEDEDGNPALPVD